MKYEQQIITPAKAKRLLTGNTHNRSVSMATVEQYARAMSRGEWVLSPQPIVVNGTRLLDGQHRLRAVIESGVSVPFVVCTGAASKVQSVLDRGRTRTTADVMSLEHGIANARSAVALARIVGLLDGALAAYRIKMTDGEVAAIIADHRDGITWATGKPKRAVVSNAAFLGVLAWMEPSAHELVEVFYHRVATGDSLGVNSPELRLRDKLMRTTRDTAADGRMAIMAMTITALRKSMDGEEVVRVTANAGDHGILWRRRHPGEEYRRPLWLEAK